MFSWCCKKSPKEEGELDTSHHKNDLSVKSSQEPPLPALEKDLLARGEVYNSHVQSSYTYFQDKYIRLDETKNISSFTQEGLLQFIKSIQSLTYEFLSDKDNINIEMNPSGSIFTEEIPVIHIQLQINKQDFNKTPSLKEIIKILFDPEQKLKNNSNLKTCEIIEDCGNDASIQKTVTKGNFLVSERETFDKHVTFEKNGIYYHYASSIPDDLNPIDEKIVRTSNYFTIVIIQDIGDKYMIDMYNQNDLKMKMPPAMVKSMLPSKMKSFQDNLIKGINAL